MTGYITDRGYWNRIPERVEDFIKRRFRNDGKGKPAKTLATTLLNVAWLSVLLGLGMEILLILAAAYFGSDNATAAIIADAVQKISWSTLVCSGVAVGMAAGKCARR